MTRGKGRSVYIDEEAATEYQRSGGSLSELARALMEDVISGEMVILNGIPVKAGTTVAPRLKRQAGKKRRFSLYVPQGLADNFHKACNGFPLSLAVTNYLLSQKEED